MRCGRIEVIRCQSHNLRSLEGCPDGLKKLWIGDAPNLSDPSPLASCSIMENLWIIDSSITDISVVASMPHLEVFVCQKDDARPSIKDLSSLSSCPRLKGLLLYSNLEIISSFSLHSSRGTRNILLPSHHQPHPSFKSEESQGARLTLGSRN